MTSPHLILVRETLVAEHPDLAGKELDTETEIADLGLDSVQTLELVAVLEDRAGVHVPDEELVHIRTLGDVVRLVEKHTKAA